VTFRDLSEVLARTSDLRLHLARPWALVLLAAIPLALVALRLAHRRAPRLNHPRVATLRRTAPGWVARLWWLPRGLSLVALALVSVALARPRSLEREALPTSVEGIDIVIAFDLSTSMRAADFQPEDRIHVAREVLTMRYRPKIVVVEYNSSFGPERSVTVPYKPMFFRGDAHPTGMFYGASLAAWRTLLG